MSNSITLPVSAVAVPSNESHHAIIVAAASSLSERTEWENRSVVTNYDYTQYVPPSCSEFYGSLAADSESMRSLKHAGDDDANIEPICTMYSAATDRPNSIRGVSEIIPPVLSDGMSSAGETFEAGPSSGLQFKGGGATGGMYRDKNTYYVITDDYDKAFRRKGLFARFKRIAGRKRRERNNSNINKTSNKAIDLKTNNGQTVNKSGLFFGRRFNSKRNQSNANDDPPTTPIAPTSHVPSMLTPNTSPDSDNNVTPSGLDGFNKNSNNITTRTAHNVPPEMPSSCTNNEESEVYASSMSIPENEEQDDFALHKDVMHSSDSSPDGDSPTNKSPIEANNPQVTSLVVGSVMDGESEKKIDKQEQKTSSRHTRDDKVPAEDTTLFINPLVVEKDDEIEMEYVVAPCPPTEEGLLHLKGDTSTLIVKIESMESRESVATLKEQSETDASSSNAKTEEIETKPNIKRGLAFQHFNTSARGSLGSAQKNKMDTPMNLTTIVAEEGDEDVRILSPEYVIESQPEPELTTYNRGISIQTKNAVAEAQMRSRVQGHPSADTSSRQAKLTNWLFGTSNTNHTSSFDNTDSVLSDSMTLQSCTDLEDDTTIPEDSLADYDDRTETSNTIVSSDSTYLTLATNTGGGCGIRRAVLLDDFNDAVVDVREGVMDMVASIRKSRERQQNNL